MKELIGVIDYIINIVFAIIATTLMITFNIISSSYNENNINDKALYVPVEKEVKFFDYRNSSDYILNDDNTVLVRDQYSYKNPSKCWMYKLYNKSEVISSLFLQGKYPTFTKLKIYGDSGEVLELKKEDGTLSKTDLVSKLSGSGITLNWLDDKMAILIPDPLNTTEYYWLRCESDTGLDSGLDLIVNLASGNTSRLMNATTDEDEKTRLLSYIDSHINRSDGSLSITGENMLLYRSILKRVIDRYLELATDEEKNYLWVTYKISKGLR